MDVVYSPPTQDAVQCSFLRRNFLTCLKQKAIKDQVPKMQCNVELILWFNLECPTHYKQFTDPQRLRSAFYAQKQLEKGPKTPSFKKL